MKRLLFFSAMVLMIDFAVAQQVSMRHGDITCALAASSETTTVGYKASIFTKDEGDELFRCEFSSEDMQNAASFMPMISSMA